ncbi:MAG: HTH-type transcriptional activator Btr [Anaerolineae bacterium]|nr:HTH-type transcriptional activator Btr [Anaerolineae bacterium]
MARLIQPEFTPDYKLHRIPRNVVAQHSRHPLLEGLHVISSGYFPHARRQYAERETIDEYIIIYCVAGKGWFRAGGVSGQAARGDVLFILKDTCHVYGADTAEPWTILWAHFNGAHVPYLLEMAGVSPEKPMVSIGERLNIVTLFNDLLNTLQRGYSLYYLINAAAQIRQILCNIALFNTYSPAAGARDLNTENVISFMVENVTAACTLDDFAAHACMSRSHFSRRFHEKTGYAPVDYFIRLKIQKACELLETSDKTIGEISHDLAYKDQYYFSRIFKQVMGVSPKNYRVARGLAAEPAKTPATPPP